jgi:signal transduction histidine kinase
MSLSKIDVASALNKAIELTVHRQPVPRLDWQAEETAISVMGDDERFVNILCHLIENAQQATPREGEVVLSVRCHNQNLKIDIQDTGCGMDPDFIHSSLYRPFVTTKGEKGTGIGVYEAKEYVSKVGGQLLVRSQKDKGSTFSLEIPLAYCT